MRRSIRWEAVRGSGLEFLDLSVEERVRARDVLCLGGEEPFLVRYELLCDAAWRVRSLRAELLTGEEHSLALEADGKGRWKDAHGRSLDTLDGCLDLDVFTSAFTNTLPIRRLDLPPGRGETIRVAYVRLPALTVEPVTQRYTCLARDRAAGGAGGLYRYEALQDGTATFTADLAVDADGVVIDYPGFYRRVRG